MPFLTLGEAVDRVLARLADQRMEKPGEVLSLPGKEARAEGGRRAPARGISEHHHSDLAKLPKSNSAAREYADRHSSSVAKRPTGNLLP